MTYTIVKNAPPVSESWARGNKYPFRQMEVNDAFDLPVEARANVTGAAHAYGSRNNKKFSVRKIGDGTYRCQRVA